MASSMPETLNNHATEVLDADEETFDLFTRYRNTNALGMVSQSSSSINLEIANRDFTISQSPGLLTSSRAGGTTGAVLWTITPLFASWIARETNFLFRNNLINSQSVVLELGAGISGLIGLCLAPKIERYILTDQEYVLKTLRQNVQQNNASSLPYSRPTRAGKHTARSKEANEARHSDSNIEILPLDWETSDLTSLKRTMAQTPNVLIAADCIFNPAIIRPFVSTLAALSLSLSHAEEDQGHDQAQNAPVMSVIAQQLRSPDVFTEWLEVTLQKFRVWRVSEEALAVGGEIGEKGLKVEQGYVVHICILREENEV